MVGSDHLSAPRVSPDLSARQRVGSLYWSRYCSQFCWRWWWKYPEAQVIYHTPALFRFTQQIDSQYDVRVQSSQSSDRRILSPHSQIKLSVFSGYIHVGTFSAPTSKVPWATFGWIDWFSFFFFFFRSCIQTYFQPRSLQLQIFLEIMTGLDIVFMGMTITVINLFFHLFI